MKHVKNYEIVLEYFEFYNILLKTINLIISSDIMSEIRH